jgi:hypothetical protein
MVRQEDGHPRAALAVPAAAADEPAVPDLPRLPGGVDAPASVSEQPGRQGIGLGVVTDARFASVDAIPGRALTAYQRAETVMRQADPSCHLSWALIAAIGSVESNHGRFGGALMTADGVVHPAILGPRLTGHGATTRIVDTDAGLLDGDRRVDRAVGPMQFIPSTWTLVGVDADGDGRRDPQDIDDASLATAVYLCSGSSDLATRAGQRAAVFRYNHSRSYVDLVLGLMAGYLHADPALFRLIGGPGLLDPYDYPTGLPGGGVGGPTPGDPQPTFDVVEPTQHPSPTGPTAQPTAKPTPSATTTAVPTPAPTTSAAVPTAVPSSGAPTPTSGETPGVSSPATPSQETKPPETAAPSETAGPTGTATPSESGAPTADPTDGPTGPGDPVDPEIPQELLDAWTACLTAGVDPADAVAMTTCLVELTGLPEDDPALLALLASPPVTPPAPTQSQQQPRARRRRSV